MSQCMANHLCGAKNYFSSARAGAARFCGRFWPCCGRPFLPARKSPVRSETPGSRDRPIGSPVGCANQLLQLFFGKCRGGEWVLRTRRRGICSFRRGFGWKGGALDALEREGVTAGACDFAPVLRFRIITFFSLESCPNSLIRLNSSRTGSRSRFRPGPDSLTGNSSLRTGSGAWN